MQKIDILGCKPCSPSIIRASSRDLAMSRFCFPEGRGGAQESLGPKSTQDWLASHRGDDKGVQLPAAWTLNWAFAKVNINILYIFAYIGTKIITERQAKAGAAHLKQEPKEWLFSIRSTNDWH